MRQVVIDTETTGLDPGNDRIVEIACVELIERRLTGNNFHAYVNPGKDSTPGALKIHGLTSAFLTDKPAFPEIVGQLSACLSGAELIAHNAPFDLAFLDAELARCGLLSVRETCSGVTDTLVMARAEAGRRANNLDALCDRYGVDRTRRIGRHGALVDAELLAHVYLAMTRSQGEMALSIEVAEVDRPGSLLVLRATEAELLEHAAYLAEIKCSTWNIA